MPVTRKDTVRTKTGCLTCRRRHKKCDEGKPACWNCTRNGLDCEGYQPPRVWESKTSKNGSRQRNVNARRRSSSPAIRVDSRVTVINSESEAGSTNTEPDVPVQAQHRPFHSQREVIVQIPASLEPRNRPSPSSLEPINSPSPSTIWVGGDASDDMTSQSSPSQVPVQTVIGVIGTLPSVEENGLYPSPSASYQWAEPDHYYDHDRVHNQDQEASSSFSSGLLDNIVLPSIVHGIDNALDRRLLHHFIGTFSKLLVSTPYTELNAINNLLLPLALQDAQDWGLLDLILSLSASHLSRALSRQHDNGLAPDVEQLEKAKWKHYSYAITRHAKNLSSLIQQDGSAEHLPGEDEDVDEDGESQIDYAIATTMLLCQWSTCEGGDQANWRIHLDANRDLVRRKFDRPADAAPVAVLSEASQTLLEWLYFHDVLATVTSPEQACINLHTGTVEAFGISAEADMITKCFSSRPLDKSMWIGANDGLLAIIVRIIALPRLNPTEGLIMGQDLTASGISIGSQRRRPSSSTSTQQMIRALKPQQLMEALSIEKALQELSLQYTTNQQSLVAQCYRLAASLMLHFTIYPMSPPESGRAYQCLSQLIALIRHISDDDSALTCSLFPLFICGVTVFREADRQLVLAKAKAYSRYCGLGHADDVVEFLQKWWNKRDGSHSCSCEPGPAVPDTCESCQLHSKPEENWWTWRKFMKEENLDLILI